MSEKIDKKEAPSADTVETTGHQWDDEEGYPLQEFNNPLPRWWLYGLYASILFAIIYWILYPAWPTPSGPTPGILGWSQYGELKEELAEAKAAQKPFNDQLEAHTLEEISKNNGLLQYAISGGKAIFGDNCAPCHGGGGVGSKAKGFPNLVDDDWLFGGTLADIEETIQNGRTGTMPAHLESAGGFLQEAQIQDLTQYVLSLTKRAKDAEATKRGDELFHGEGGCNGCHGDKGLGSLKGRYEGDEIDRSTGAPNLADAIWLYGKDEKTIAASIAKGRTGKMPAWGEGFEGFGRQLTPLSIKQVTLYVYTLGGGE